MRCPICKAENNDATCRRCKADLSPLFAQEEARRQALAEATRAVAAGESDEAISHAETAHQLRADPESMRLLALAYLLKKDFRKAAALHGAALSE